VYLTYLVGGVLCDGTGCKIQIVREEDLEKAKAEFKALTSEHVYSVQKARTLPDLGVLYAVDCHKRDENEMGKRLVHQGGSCARQPECTLLPAFDSLPRTIISQGYVFRVWYLFFCNLWCNLFLF
jgi:hypothetical protein